MAHTFLLEEGTWRVEGEHRDAAGAASPVSGDAILSSYASPSARYRGFECIQQRDARSYSVRGALLEEDKVISTWAVELTLA